jgi:hypothetical protein
MPVDNFLFPDASNLWLLILVIASFAAAAVVSLNPYFGDCLRPFLTY